MGAQGRERAARPGTHPRGWRLGQHGPGRVCWTPVLTRPQSLGSVPEACASRVTPRACTHSREEPSARLRPRPGARPRRAGRVRSSSPGSASLSAPRASLPRELTSSPASGPGALGLLWETCARCGQISREKSKPLPREEMASFVVQLRAQAVAWGSEAPGERQPGDPASARRPKFLPVLLSPPIPGPLVYSLSFHLCSKI